MCLGPYVKPMPFTKEEVSAVINMYYVDEATAIFMLRYTRQNTREASLARLVALESLAPSEDYLQKRVDAKAKREEIALDARTCELSLPHFGRVFNRTKSK